MEQNIIKIVDILNEISKSISPKWYNLPIMLAIIGVAGTIFGVIIGFFLNQKVRQQERRDAEREKLTYRAKNIRFQFIQLIPRLEDLIREVDKYVAGSAPSFSSQLGYTHIKALLLLEGANEEDNFFKMMEELMDLNRYMSPTTSWPNKYSSRIKELLKQILKECSVLKKLTNQELITRFNIDN